MHQRKQHMSLSAVELADHDDTADPRLHALHGGRWEVTGEPWAEVTRSRAARSQQHLAIAPWSQRRGATGFDEAGFTRAARDPMAPDAVSMWDVAAVGTVEPTPVPGRSRGVAR